jgi:predicted O-methyltransferase YrrM
VAARRSRGRAAHPRLPTPLPPQVDDDWILRRLERWGRRDMMPFLGPQKAGAVRALVAAKRPRVAVEVGAMAGYSAICIGQVCGRGVRRPDRGEGGR